MRARLTRTLLVLTAWAVAAPLPVSAGVIVIANRSPEEVSFALTPAGGAAQDHKLPPRELMAVPADGSLSITFPAKGERRTQQLEADRAYAFGDAGGGLELTGIGSPPRRDRPEATRPESAAARTKKEVLTLPVMVLVDQCDPMGRDGWEPRLRKRVEAASAILERQCRVKLEVVAVDTWESDNRLTELNELLRDFEGKVKLVKKARVAIGFTSQRFAHVAGLHLGGIRQPLANHILVREYFPKSESERLEVLVHELGHFLGATHSPEGGSVMRPNLGDGRSLKSDFPIGLDPLNALAASLVAEDMAGREPKRLGDLSRATRERLAQVYEEISPTIPKDPTPTKYLTLLGLKPQAPDAVKP
jgi:hypothetical protein